jgi:hypothetical protein
MSRAEALESELEGVRSQHGDAVGVLRAQQEDLEEYLGQVRFSSRGRCVCVCVCVWSLLQSVGVSYYVCVGVGGRAFAAR